MRCESCQGTGKRRRARADNFVPEVDMLPCDECGGSGISHCCDGITACNDWTATGGEAVESEDQH